MILLVLVLVLLFVATVAGALALLVPLIMLPLGCCISML